MKEHDPVDADWGYIMSNVTIRKHLEAYQATAEQWKKDHEDAMQCYDVQDSVKFGLFILDVLHQLDEEIRLRCFKGNEPKDAYAKLCNEVEELYQRWFRTSEVHLEIVASLVSKGHTVEGAEELRKAFQTVGKMLTPDDEFFSAAPLVDLRDEAVDAHARGETTEWSANS